jgi:Conserved TM helix
MTGNGLGQGLSDMWRAVLAFLPSALAFLAILAVGYVAARVLRSLVAKALHRAGFDRAVDRGAVGRALRTGNVRATDLCAKIVFYGVLLFALQAAFGIWGPNPVSDLLTGVISWLPRAFVAIVVIVVAAAIAGAVHDLITSALGGLSYGRVLARAASIVIITLGVIAALDQLRIATSVTQPVLIAVLATIAGVVIVGVGGGLIRPMQRRWESWLDRAGAESAAIRDHARAYAEERRRQEAAAVAGPATRAAGASAGYVPQPAGAGTSPDTAAAGGPVTGADGRPSDETQVIPPRQHRTRPSPADDPEATTVIAAGTPGSPAAPGTPADPAAPTSAPVGPPGAPTGPNDTLVIGASPDETQAIPPAARLDE